MQPRSDRPIAQTVVRLRLVLELAVFAVAAIAVAWSAVLVKEAHSATPLMSVDRGPAVRTVGEYRSQGPIREVPKAEVESLAKSSPTVSADAAVRWFNGRPIRPARTLWMTVTAYSPDHRSCGIFADGKTSTLHSVWTNGMRLVAADTRVLPFGSMITVPGYAGGEVVPVLDRGGKIKGHRLDVLYPSHQAARQWGVRKLPVVVWEYADGKPAPDPRRERQ